MPSFHRPSISEFNCTQPLLSWAFPTLLPHGEAEYTLSRERTVPFPGYIKHLLKFHDGRFARHPRFRYVVFNIMMRSLGTLLFYNSYINSLLPSIATSISLSHGFHDSLS